MDELKNYSYGKRILNTPISQIENLSERLERLSDNPDDFDFWVMMEKSAIMFETCFYI